MDDFHFNFLGQVQGTETPRESSPVQLVALVVVAHAVAVHRPWKVRNPGSTSVALFLGCIDDVPFLVVALLGFACRVLQVLLRQVDFDFADRQDC